MLAAFTYGKKLKYSEIDDPDYIERLKSTINNKKISNKKSGRAKSPKSRGNSNEVLKEPSTNQS